jgi:O-succinylhomoserine sulfhydrylase
VRARKLTEEVFKYLRTAGPTLSAFNAWVLLKGLETLKLSRHGGQCRRLANWLEAHPKWRVFSIRLAFASAARTGQGTAESRRRHRSFEVKGGREQAWTVVDHCQLLSITANLGDTKTTITHPPPPRTAAFPRKPGPPPASTKACCALRSASKRWKTCRPISNAASP